MVEFEEQTLRRHLPQTVGAFGYYDDQPLCTIIVTSKELGMEEHQIEAFNHITTFASALL